MSVKRRFTKWYVKKGYKFGYDFTDVPVYGDGFMAGLQMGMEAKEE